MPNQTRKSTEFRALEGFRSHSLAKAGDATEPKPALKSLKTPRDLSPGALRVWRELLPQLEACGLVREIDATAFRTLCEISASLKTIHKELEDAPLVVDGKTNPLLVERRQLAAQLKSYVDLFGLSPRSRMGMMLENPSKEKSAMEKLLDGE